MLSQTIEQVILATEASLLTDLFIVVLFVAFLLGCSFKRADRYHAYTQYVPTLLTTLGILGTFFGIVAGLLGFDVKDIDSSIGVLLAGMKTAFTTSLVGMCLSVIYKILVSFGVLAPRNEVAIDEDQIGAVDLYTVMTQQRDGIIALKEAIGGGDESSLTGQMKLLRSDMHDSTKESRIVFDKFQEGLWLKLQDFAEMLSKSATETVIEALNQVIRDFNTNLTDQFGENFKQLNESVKKLVEWQENYKVQLGEMTQHYAEGVTAISQTEAAVAKITEHTTKIPESMGQLCDVISVNQHQIDELGRHLQAFTDIRDRAVDAVPQLDARIEQTLAGVETASTRLSNGLSSASEDLMNSISQGTEQLVEGVTGMNASLTTASNEIVANSDQIKTLFQDTTSDINNSFRNMAKNMDDHTKSIAENLHNSGEALIDEAARSRKSFESGLESMREHLGSSINHIIEQQASQLQGLVDGIKKSMEDSIRNTAVSVEKQVATLDSAMEQEINNSMKQMGVALTSITGRFTEDYQSLVNQMKAVVSSKAA